MATTKKAPPSPATKTTTPVVAVDTAHTKAELSSTNTGEAKSRFNAALDEAKAGTAALVDEAKARASTGRTKAKANADDWTADAKVKAGELAVEGKHKASDALVGLSSMIDENAALLDEKFGAKYGDYARNASRSLRETATSIEEKSYEELGEDAREAVRKSPAAAVGVAALAGFFVARLFRR